MSHSVLAPSSSGVWVNCPGSVVMQQCYPETEESEEAKAGTAAHEIAAAIIEDESGTGAKAHQASDWEGAVASNGAMFTEEMFDAAAMFADVCLADIQRLASPGGTARQVGIEAKVSAPRVHELSFGTVDFWAYNPGRAELVVRDFKFGFEIVEAFENWQLINYAAGLLDELQIDGRLDQTTTVRLGVVQPRAFHRDGPAREWVVTASDLRGYVNRLAAAANKALGPDAETQSGAHCKHCSARHACPAALQAGVRLYEAAAAPVPVELNPQALAVQYAIVQRARKQLEYLESGYDEQIKGLLRAGHSVPGYRVEEGVGRERWAKPVEEVIALGDMLGHDLRKRDAITPNQARKLGIDAAVIMAYSEKPRTGIKVVPDNGNKAKQVFSK